MGSIFSEEKDITTPLYAFCTTGTDCHRFLYEKPTHISWLNVHVVFMFAKMENACFHQGSCALIVADLADNLQNKTSPMTHDVPGWLHLMGKCL